MTRRTGRLGAFLAGLALLGAACRGGAPAASPTPRELTASPEDSPGATPSGPAPAPTTTASPSPGESPTEGDPTDTDRARFIADYAPADASDLEHAAADVDGDGIEEIVFVFVRTGPRVSRVEVAWWDPDAQEYAIAWGDDGGPAERVERLRVSDVNDDGRTEIAVSQAVGSSGGSLTLWRANVAVPSFQPLIASGGCHSGSNTYGVIGAELRDADGDAALEIFATCDDSPLPPAAWNTDVYDWADGVYAYSRTEFANG